MTAQMERILVSLSLVFILEAVWTVCALVLLFHFMNPEPLVSIATQKTEAESTHRSSSSLSNFLGFFGQHSHT
jgi:hypothetical protein